MKTDLIYGVEDRPPFKDALFAALQHLLAIFVAIITPPLIPFCFGGIYVYTMPSYRPDRSEAALYPRYQFLLYRSYHSDRISRRTSVDIRLLYSCRTY